MSEELYINIRLEGVTPFTGKLAEDEGAPTGTAEVPTNVIITCGLSGWKDDPYRAQVCTAHRSGIWPDPWGHIEDTEKEYHFETDRELSAWLEKTVNAYKDKGFKIARYKANGCDVDWLNGVNLPPS